MNEAAILAARRNLKEVSKEEIADALERIVAGPEKKGAVVSEPKKRLVAYHEVCVCVPTVHEVHHVKTGMGCLLEWDAFTSSHRTGGCSHVGDTSV